ncbi:uroporphyrinogen-III synthase [Aestuariirhabdus sp. Z084]|uniref:uroporphyrinogen-III synthase n=1 Tax=Aestuariirhabdus haliotis TaxID=2918751 RepID=UPI00201B3D42|nr:uroporphyrinogen-III synthase [Aestuariirhabdus haliotis]MCL6416132.1 uroporphyrinogen-III synthase [Aestuariirhabdus haliotis]MCL6420111.1 uroporphyrinogen-III synthase [Aestuariirhabdus haliotis]
MPSSTTTDLSALRVLVTRPAEQAERLAGVLREAGASALVLPLIEPRALALSESTKAQVLDLDRFDKVLFISRSAARFGGDLIDRYWPQMPLGLSWFAIGQSTAAELERLGIEAAFSRTGTDSEALLELADFDQINEQRILLIKGYGGREHLSAELTRRGAEVVELAVYERHPVPYQPSVFGEHLTRHHTNLAVATSGGIAERLTELLDDGQRAHLHLLVPSHRVAQLMVNAGYASVWISDGAADSAIMETLQRLVPRLGANHSE